MFILCLRSQFVAKYYVTHLCSALVLGKPMSVKPSRIIAGQEPEKTNEFLQSIARAAQKKVLLLSECHVMYN